MPMPMNFILLTDNRVGKVMKGNKEYFLRGHCDELDEMVLNE